MSISTDDFAQILTDEGVMKEREEYITNMFYAINISDFRNNILKKITYYTKKVSDLNNHIKKEIKLDKNIGIIDFIYFSSITTTTIGYGDIIPNSTFVRIIIILHSIIAVLFLAFAGFLITSKKETTS